MVSVEEAVFLRRPWRWSRSSGGRRSRTSGCKKSMKLETRRYGSKWKNVCSYLAMSSLCQ